MTACRVLLVTGSHGSPPNRLRLERACELGRHLQASGATVDQLILQEHPLAPVDAERLAGLRACYRELEVVREAAATRWGRVLASLIPERRRVRACPRAFLASVRRRCARHGYHAVVIGSPRYLAAGPAARGAALFLDLTEVEAPVRDALRRLGREDALEPARRALAPDVQGRPIRGVLVPSPCDARRLAENGTGAPILVVPPIAPEVPGPPGEPVRPPRILVVASETVANLDGIRWFRRRVLPEVLRLVPSCRLRVAGESGRHLEAGPDIDRVGWSDRLDREYRDAAVVLLPLRLGGRLRRRAVEALGYGKALALTDAAAYGLELRHRRDAIVASDGSALAQGIADVLRHDVLRKRLEARSLQVAAERFASRVALSPLLEALEESASAPGGLRGLRVRGTP